MTIRGELFERVAILDVGTTRIRDLRIAFKADKRLDKNPNTLDVQVWNLAESTRRALQQKSVPVRLLAGYANATVETIFQGDATLINHTREGPDWITHIQSGDGVDACRRKRCSISFAKGTRVADAASKLAEATGLPLGNLPASFETPLPDTPTHYTKGVAFTGSAYDALERVVATLGLGLSIQDGALQVHALDDVGVGDEVVLLTARTGLIGSPEMCEEKTEKKKRHYLKVRSLIQSRLLPGRIVRIESAAVNGNFRCERCQFVGDTRDAPWYADLELVQAR